MKGKKTGRWAKLKPFKEERTCKVCGKKFVVTARNKSQKYCSHECYNKDPEVRKERRERMMNVKNPSWKGGVDSIGVEKTCLYCGRKFRVPKRREKEAKFCSLQCFNSFRLMRRKRNIEYGAAYFRIRELVKIRDGYRCRICGSKSNLEVHHIIPVKYFHNKELAHLPENLITLCRSCHTRVERYGQVNRLLEIGKNSHGPGDCYSLIVELCKRGWKSIKSDGGDSILLRHTTTLGYFWPYLEGLPPSRG